MSAGVLETVRAREHLICGVGDGPKGYSTVDAEGIWSGISVDFCRALAAAVLGSKDAVKFRPVLKSERFSALQAGEIDVLSRNVAMTSSHDTALGVRFPGVLVFDGQGFMVRKSQGVASALELSGARICVMAETADAQGIGDYFSALRMPFELSKFDKWPDAVAAYTNKSCQVLSADVSVLGLARQQFADPSEHMHPAGDRRPAAGRAGGQAGRRGLVQRRALDDLCADRGGGAGHHQRQCRRHEGFDRARRCAAFSVSTRTSAGGSASAPTGRSA